jgi:indolepyruvate ferredoxin oxidoreductase
MFMGASIPVLAPANVQEVLDLGIFGWELSRFSGCWVGLKAITENMDSAISALVDPNRVNIVIPQNIDTPPEGVHGRWPATPLEQERILNKYRIYMAREFARVNGLNRVMLDSPNARFGIMTSGKAYLDVMQALEDLGIDEELAKHIGLRVFKVGMPWPLEPVATHEFARGLEEILVVEEKRSVIEDQLTGQLYNWSVAERPRVIGEFDERGADLLPNLAELTPAMVARAIASRIQRYYDSPTIQERLAFLEAKEAKLAKPRAKLDRNPHYCSGCPHNTSTKVPEGSRAMAGIGCHYMVTWMDRRTDTFTQMGGEGTTWIGQAPFTETKHVFQNLGDGTYFHSGLLAIRAAVAAGVNITYKLLFNDAVAMTGGQPHDGPLTVPMIVDQLLAEGIQRIAIVSDDTQKYRGHVRASNGISIHHRDDMTEVQLQFRELKGTTVIIYDQTCAAEKRRRRKKGLMDDPNMRVFINEDVCEGCGDCGVESNCLSVLPNETELGRKRRIDQTACNKDFSCVRGFCPSFVTVHGGKLRKAEGPTISAAGELPEPQRIASYDQQPWNILVTGVGGTGVLTISSLLAMAAHIEGKGCSTLNQTGLAQKFGAVVSHVRIAETQDDINAVRIAAGDADLLVGCDLAVSDSDDALAKLNSKRSYGIVNEYESATASFLRDPDTEFHTGAMQQTLREEIGEEKTHFVDATEIATRLLGDSIGSNLFLLGYAYQQGLIPVSAEAIMQAIELNAVAVSFNQQAFTLGRQAVVDPAAVANPVQVFKPMQDWSAIVDWRQDFLIDYQDNAYADKYRRFVDVVEKKIKRRLNEEGGELSKAVARNLFKLMAYKDEYEVARLYSNGSFEKKIAQVFEGDYEINFHLAPPMLSPKDPVTGHLRKRAFPAWTMRAFRLLAKFKHLRGGPFDIFARTEERQKERAMIKEYCDDVAAMLDALSEDNYAAALEVARLPEAIRGYGHVKDKNIEAVEQRRQELLDRFYGRVQIIEHEQVA